MITNYEFGPQGSNIERAELVVIGGALTRTFMRDTVYGNFIGKDSELDPRLRFIPNPSELIGNVDEMYKRVEYGVETAAEKAGARVVLLGHSLGGEEADQIGHNRPDIVTGVIHVGGLQNGFESLNPAIKGISFAAGDPADAALMMPNSPYLLQRRQERKQNWPRGVLVASAAATIDLCFPRFHDLKTEYPEDVKHEIYIVAPSNYSEQTLIKMAFASRKDLPEGVMRIPSRFPTEHGLVVKAGGLAMYAKDFRAKAAVNGLKLGPTPPPTKLFHTKPNSGLAIAA